VSRFAEIEAAVARWRDAERRLMDAAPGTSEWEEALALAREAQAEYNRIVTEWASRNAGGGTEAG